ncbi:UDP-N-acetyl-alpha-D-glucosamine C6 dehydratase [Roseovarius sp. A-2]|uniref:UDP-N-acetylglucosamine 4,6-dehydratase family protein n=1 Tax=Roseovarius sp. A-2 TaxID=1570360 RepID=UPI0009B50C3A|nr:UDP-N-acetylglucosamine 4,6-dehydratase family protein [Roseovarius sp. A-2]GAW33154.1 UDP-N-acetyl-alpha-D-glucosamine C6 dehydratase [Roseovarius sp. A-2]
MADRLLNPPRPALGRVRHTLIEAGLMLLAVTLGAQLVEDPVALGTRLLWAVPLLLIAGGLGSALDLHRATPIRHVISDMARIALVAGVASLSGMAVSAITPSGPSARLFIVAGIVYLLFSGARHLWRRHDGGTRPTGRAVNPAALLGRDALENELPDVSDVYSGRRILVTGAGGSIGSELCRQLVQCAPKTLILMDHGEHVLFQIERELRSLAPELEIIPILGSVCDAALVNVLMRAKKIDVVLHAAAYKHVPLVELNAIEGMRNNVLGTRTVANAAREAGVERFILVSTDKAVRPTSVMGGSKRFAEMIVQDLATRSDRTRFSMVRFGNVLGSSGSVIPVFADQIAQGGPVTLTHPEVTRYFMTIPEAVRLVLLAGSFARDGDVFVLDMGKPVAIQDIARRMIEASGYSVRDAANPRGDIEIEITGLRPGEKLHEELLIGSDMLTTPHPCILRAQEGHLSEIELAKALKSLSEAIETRDMALLRSILAQWIEQVEEDEAVND